MKNKAKTLLGAFVLVLFAVIGGLHLAQGPKTTPTSAPRAVLVTVAAPVAKPVAIAHPAEGELNKLGLTLAGGIAVRAGLAKNSTEGGAK